jgi:hypothetical protein
MNTVRPLSATEIIQPPEAERLQLVRELVKAGLIAAAAEVGRAAIAAILAA